MRALRLVSFLAISVLALSATSAQAQRVPPGLSGANQYTETLPGPGGNETASGVHEKETDPAKAIGTSNAARLEALGSEGQAAAQLAADGAPDNHGSGSESGGSSKSSANPSSSSGLSQILGQVTGSSSDSGGMGLLLPLLIAVAVIGAIAFAISRRRTAQPQD